MRKVHTNTGKCAHLSACDTCKRNVLASKFGFTNHEINAEMKHSRAFRRTHDARARGIATSMHRSPNDAWTRRTKGSTHRPALGVRVRAASCRASSVLGTLRQMLERKALHARAHVRNTYPWSIVASNVASTNNACTRQIKGDRTCATRARGILARMFGATTDARGVLNQGRTSIFACVIARCFVDVFTQPFRQLPIFDRNFV